MNQCRLRFREILLFQRILFDAEQVIAQRRVLLALLGDQLPFLPDDGVTPIAALAHRKQ